MTSLLEITVFYFFQSQILYCFVSNSRLNQKNFYVINHDSISTYLVGKLRFTFAYRIS